MSFFRSLARAFGFGPADDSDLFDDDAPSALVTPLKKEQPSQEVAPADSDDNSHDAAGSESDIPEALFDGVLEIFNSAQPDFIKNCLDKEAQRRYIYERLESSFHDYLSQREEVLRKEAEDKVDSMRVRLQTELDQLRSRCKEMDEKEKATKEQKMSAERQKRALNERIRDLENQNLTLQAEREQLDLENRSLLNKMKVASVREQDDMSANEAIKEITEQSEKKIAELQEHNDLLKSDLSEAISTLESMKDIQTRVDKVNETIKSKDELIKTLGEEKDALTKHVQELETEVEKLRSSELESKAALDASLSDLQSAKDKIEEKEKITRTRSEMSNKMVSELRNTNNRLEHELSEALATLEGMKDLQKKIDKIQESVPAKDEMIKNLKFENEGLLMQISQLEKTNSELKSRIEESIAARAEAELEFNRKIEDLKDKQAEKTEEKPKRRKKTYKISAIDETLDSTQWLVATPPEGVVAKATGTTPDPDFGYQAPQRKPAPENDAQMTLF